MATIDQQAMYETARAEKPFPVVGVALGIAASAVIAAVGTYFGYLLVVALVLLVIVLAAAFARPEVATLVVFFALYSNLAVILVRQGLPTGLAGGVFLLLGLPLLNNLFIKHRGLVITPVFIVMIAYLGVLVFSAAMADRPKPSYERITSYVLEGLLLYFLVVNTVRSHELLRKAIWVVLLAGMAMGSVTLYQGLTGAYDNDFGGWATVTQSQTSIGEEDFLGNQPMVPRLAGPIGEKNRYAQIMVVLLPLAIGRIWAERSFRLRALAAIMIVPIVGGALLTFSRGAGFGLLVTLAVLMVVRMVPVRYVLLLAVIVGVVGVGLVPGYLYRISNVNISDILTGNLEESDTSVQGRMTQYLTAIVMIRDNPVFGVGPGQASRYITEYARGIGYKVLDTNRRTHNMYLEEMADTGLVGFSVLMGIIGLTMVQLASMRARFRLLRPDISYTAASFMLSIVAYLATAVFLHLAYIRYFWFLLALSGAAIAVWTAMIEVAPPRRNPLSQAIAEPADTQI